MAWTQEQKQAIEYRDGNLLVSAAAGSGKTAVLVERIISRILDQETPIDIDSIVVVTFTKAAAKEMKIRLSKRFEQEILLQPNNRHLIKQMSLIDNARITTIDSFCAYILRNYYNAIELDPGFKIGDPGELELMKADVLEELLEFKFQESSESFLSFVEAYVPGKRLDGLRELILQFYRYSESHPWPLEWIEKCRDSYGIQSEQEYYKLPLIKNLFEYTINLAKECVEEYRFLIELCENREEFSNYIKTCKADSSKFELVINSKNMKELQENIGFLFDRLSPCRKCTDEFTKEIVQSSRNAIKKRHQKLLENFYQEEVQDSIVLIGKCKPYIEELTELTLLFSQMYKKAKTEKNILDFSDVEHLALEILIHKNNEKVEYTSIADELAMEINEIYIDEYQDSNMVQEFLLTSISKVRFEKPNIFMVGDVKQSIYKFRMANPYIFMDKYNQYSNEQGPYRKIELHSNFRSRKNVLECINDIFYKTMKKSVGGVAYTDQVRLNAGKEFDNNIDDTTEILIADKSEFKGDVIQSAEINAHMIADRIEKLRIENTSIEYKDIVILLRSDKLNGPIYASILNSHGIPCMHTSSTGYFSAIEVKTILNLLNIVDNPRQDIPLAATMRSYFACFTPEELALIKGNRKKKELYECLIEKAEQIDELGQKVALFLKWLNKYREISKVMSISELISGIVYNTGYMDYLGMQKNGNIKKINITMMIEKAREFQKTSYTGLFNFLRYIDKLHKYEIDYGEAGNDVDENVVKIMSIHKSKGLEFPIVILGEMNKEYNQQDTKSKMLFESEFGIGTDYVDINTRVSRTVVLKKLIGRQIKTENIGEELRILYVAMTRAMDKLIMVGNCSLEKSQKKWEITNMRQQVSENYILENLSYLDLVMSSIDMESNLGKFKKIIYEYNDIMEITKNNIRVETDEIQNKIEKLKQVEEVKETNKNVKKVLDFEYPYKNLAAVKAKYSVSDLKHKAMEESEFLEVPIAQPDHQKPIPIFMQQENNSKGGIQRGNAYHKFFEILDYKRIQQGDLVKDILDDYRKNKLISEEYFHLIESSKIEKFLNTSLGKSMIDADIRGQLYREQPFVMEIGSDEVNQEFDLSEKVLIQGIIDAFYIEKNEIHIVDYKTDYIENVGKGETLLIERYSKQLELYKRALEGFAGCEVKGVYIYSVALDKSINLTYN